MELYNLRLFSDKVTRINENGIEKVLTKKYAKQLQAKNHKKKKHRRA